MAKTGNVLPKGYKSWAEVWEKVVQDGNHQKPDMKYIFSTNDGTVFTCLVLELQHELFLEQQEDLLKK